mmetsp:Transcript_60311/g.70492  ORF Transcript_60311/g.70492 Transcript_60311/m.70492 type:complete len:94 (+) Transcript_60311:261-542(+)
MLLRVMHDLASRLNHHHLIVPLVRIYFKLIYLSKLTIIYQTTFRSQKIRICQSKLLKPQQLLQRVVDQPPIPVVTTPSIFTFSTFRNEFYNIG